MTENPAQTEGRSSRAQRLSGLSAWLKAESPKGDVDSILKSFRNTRQYFFEEMADRLEPVLNEYLQRQPQTTYEEKKQLAKWLNAALRALDLAVECPRTKMPAILVANTGDNPVRGRFQLNVALPDGRRTKTRSMTPLAELSLTSRDAGFDKETLWQERMRNRREGGHPSWRRE